MRVAGLTIALLLSLTCCTTETQAPKRSAAIRINQIYLIDPECDALVRHRVTGCSQFNHNGSKTNEWIYNRHGQTIWEQDNGEAGDGFPIQETYILNRWGLPAYQKDVNAHLLSWRIHQFTYHEIAPNVLLQLNFRDNYEHKGYSLWDVSSFVFDSSGYIIRKKFINETRDEVAWTFYKYAGPRLIRKVTYHWVRPGSYDSFMVSECYTPVASITYYYYSKDFLDSAVTWETCLASPFTLLKSIVRYQDGLKVQASIRGNKFTYTYNEDNVTNRILGRINWGPVYLKSIQDSLARMYLNSLSKN